MTDTPETDELIRKYMTVIGTDAIGMASKLTLKCMDLERERDEAREQRDAWKAKFIQQNKDLGCEMMDPNGTIWDYAKKMQKDLDAAIAERDELKRTNDGLWP